ncbi:MAG TPA: hypothetical protein VHB49_15880 [Bradyrhizobium sp.]|nr:hypothetical protein [Bradyrhizobium sp.]
MAFSNDVEIGSREENASKQEAKAGLDQSQKGFAPRARSRKEESAEDRNGGRCLRPVE